MNKIKNSPGIILTISVIVSFITAFMGSSTNVAVPAIGKEFSASAVLLSWIATSYVLTSVIFLIPAGKLSDIYGRVRFFKYGMLIFTAGSILSALSASTLMLIAFRAFMGLGSALIFINSTSIIVSAYPPDKRGRVLGITISAVYTGLSTGPFLGGIITQNIGWRYIFYISFIFCLIVTSMTYFFMTRDWIIEEGNKFNYKSASLFSLAIASVMLGFTFLPGIPGIVLLISGMILFWLYKKHSESASNPVLNLDIFRHNRSFTFSNIAALINYSATFAISFLLSLYFQHIKSMTPQEAGTLLVTQPVFMALFSPLAGRASDKIEPRYVSSAGMLLITICLAFLCFISPETSVIYILVNLAILGLGFALFSSPNSNAIMGAVEKKHYGLASTVLSLMRMAGQMSSMAIVIVIFSVLIGGKEIVPANHEGLITSIRIAFTLFSALCLFGVSASLSRGNMYGSK